MGIPHFEDLDFSAILDVLDLRWTLTEKLDGSFMSFGLDSDGRFFSRTKDTNTCYYDVNDWPAEGWTNAFRAAHGAAETLCDYLVDREILWSNTYINCEVMYGDRPNTIPYNNEASLVITGWSRSADMADLAFACREFEASRVHQVYSSDDARTKQLKHLPLTWQVIVLEPISGAYTWARMREHASSVRRIINNFLDRVDAEVKIPNRLLMQMKLNVKLHGWPNETWPNIRTAIRKVRAEWQKLIVPELLDFKDKAFRALLQDSKTTLPCSRYHEGLVVKTWSNTLCKFVDRRGFTAANLRAHWVKYALVGGRRPNRPSFLTRTDDWPLEKRLARLDVLRERYLRNKNKLAKSFPNGHQLMPVAYERELHERTKLLFVDLRQRLLDGR